MNVVSKIVERVDPETGLVEVIETSKSFVTKVSGDEFYMTFVKFMSSFFKLNSINAVNILVWMCQHAEYNTGTVYLTTAGRKEIEESLGICKNTISNCLKSLKDLKLISGEKGIYIINPLVFWKGTLATRKKMLDDQELRITFEIS